jgi:hypothetical protein
MKLIYNKQVTNGQIMEGWRLYAYTAYTQGINHLTKKPPLIHYSDNSGGCISL